MGQGFSAGDFGPSESVENAGILYVFPISGVPIKDDALYGERRSPNTVGISRLQEMEFCVWCFDDLPDWGKRFAENRRSHCAVLP